MPHVNELLVRDHIATLLEESRSNALARSAATSPRRRTSLRTRLAAALAAARASAIAATRLVRPPDPARRLDPEAAD